MREALPYLLIGGSIAAGIGIALFLRLVVLEVLRFRSPCPTCQGEGLVTQEYDLGWIRAKVDCHACGGSGRSPG